MKKTRWEDHSLSSEGTRARKTVSWNLSPGTSRKRRAFVRTKKQSWFVSSEEGKGTRGGGWEGGESGWQLTFTCQAFLQSTVFTSVFTCLVLTTSLWGWRRATQFQAPSIGDHHGLTKTEAKWCQLEKYWTQSWNWVQTPALLLLPWSQ